MRISEILNNEKQFISLEVVPPLKSTSRAELLDSIRPLMEFNPPYINVTNHRDEYVFKQQPDGSDAKIIKPAADEGCQIRNAGPSLDICARMTNFDNNYGQDT